MSEQAAEAPEGADEVAAGIDSSVEVAQLRAELEASRKREEFMRGGYVAARKPGWIEEAKRLNPELAALIGAEGFARVEADSRRGFLRATEALAETHGPSIAALKSLKESASSSVQAARLEATETARREVIEAWGKPAGDAVPAFAHKPEKKDLEATLKALVDQA